MIKEFKHLLKYGKVTAKEINLIFLLLFWNTIFSFLLPQISLLIFDDAIAKKNLDLLFGMLSTYILLIALNNILIYILNKKYISLGNKLVFNLRKNLVNHILELDGDYYSNSMAGNISSIIYEDAAIVKNFLISNLFNMISDLCMGIPIAIIILCIQPQLFIEIILLQPIIFLLQVFFSKKTYSISKITRGTASKVNSTLQESMGNLILIAISNMKQYFSDRVEKELGDLKSASEKLEVTMVAKNISMNGILAIWTITMLGLGGYKVVQGEMTVGELLVLMQYSPKLFLPITSVLSFNIEGKRVKVSVERLKELIFTEPGASGENRDYGIDKKDINTILFQNVFFSYCTKEKVLENFNIRIEGGSFSALVGKSGSGKSTIINLLTRLWEPSNGMIKIGNENIAKYEISYLRGKIGVISQTILLVNGTILDNITLGNQFSVKEIEDVLKICELEKFILSLNKGLYTVVGDNGVKLSGGQKQRIQIARMLLRKTPILILDEATSALDGIIESQIIAKIRLYYKKTTILLITHRLWSLENCDVIYVLDKGEIVEKGKYDYLINKEGIFRNMYNSEDNK